MKKSLLALAALSATAGIAQAQSSVQIYGIVDTGVAYSSTAAAPTAVNPRATGHYAGIDSGLLQSSRIGFRGKEDLGGGLNAIFVLEGGLNIDNGSFQQGGIPFGRRSVVGLEGRSFGTLQVGRRKDFTDEVAEPYSSITPFGTYIVRVHDNNLDRIGGNRANNMLYYSTPNWGGFRANVTFGLGETAGNFSAGQSLGYGANYASGPFGIGFGYWQSKLGVVTATANSSSDQGATAAAGCNTVGLGTPGDVCFKTWIVGSRYRLGDLTIRGTWSKVKQPLIGAANAAGAAPSFATAFTRSPGSGAFTTGGSNNTDARIVDVGVDYQWSNWEFNASYIQSNYSFVGAAADGKLTQAIAGVKYYLSKRTTLFGHVSAMKASAMYSPGIIGPAPGADNSQTALGVGIRHTF